MRRGRALSLALFALFATHEALAQQGPFFKRPPMKRPPPGGSGLFNPFATAAPPPQPQPQPPPSAPAPREARLSSELDADALPQGALPEPFDPSARPGELSAETPPGLKLSPREGQVRLPGQAATMKLEGAGTSVFQVQTHPNSPARDFQWVTCDPHTNRPPTPVRWETFSLDAKGEASWTIADGWLDAKACRVALQRQTVLRPRPALLHGDLPLAFALRTPEGLLVLFPGADTVVADAMTGQAKQVKGPIARVLLPLAKGAASTAVVQAGSARVGTFFSLASGRSPASSRLAPGSLIVRVEATQTVAERAPMVLFSAKVPTL